MGQGASRRWELENGRLPVVGAELRGLEVVLAVGLLFVATALLAGAHGSTATQNGSTGGALVGTGRVLVALSIGACGALGGVALLRLAARARLRRGGVTWLSREQRPPFLSQLGALAVALSLVAGFVGLLFISRGKPEHPHLRGAGGTSAPSDLPNSHVTAVGGGWYGLGAAAVLVAMGLWYLVQRRRRSRSPSLWQLGGGQDEAPLVLEAVREAGLGRLRDEPDARRGVIAAYEAMRSELSRRGLPPLAAEAPLEYLARILDVLGTSGAPSAPLTELYERAGYSTQPITEGDRARALASLGELGRRGPV